MQDFKTYTEARLTYDQFMADRPSSKFKFMWSVEGMRGRNLFRRNYYSNFPKNKARSAFDDVKKHNKKDLAGVTIQKFTFAGDNPNYVEESLSEAKVTINVTKADFVIRMASAAGLKAGFGDKITSNNKITGQEVVFNDDLDKIMSYLKKEKMLLNINRNKSDVDMKDIKKYQK